MEEDDWAKDNTVKGDDWAATSGTSSWKPSSWANKPAYNPPKIEEVEIKSLNKIHKITSLDYSDKTPMEALLNKARAQTSAHQ